MTSGSSLLFSSQFELKEKARLRSRASLLLTDLRLTAVSRNSVEKLCSQGLKPLILELWRHGQSRALKRSKKT